MERHFQYWGALYILAVLFVGSIAGQWVYQVVLGDEDVTQFAAAVFENWQSEWIQLFVQALLIQGLGNVLYKKEKEDQERMERKLDDVLAFLKPGARAEGRCHKSSSPMESVPQPSGRPW